MTSVVTFKVPLTPRPKKVCARSLRIISYGNIRSTTCFMNFHTIYLCGRRETWKCAWGVRRIDRGCTWKCVGQRFPWLIARGRPKIWKRNGHVRKMRIISTCKITRGVSSHLHFGCERFGFDTWNRKQWTRRKPSFVLASQWSCFTYSACFAKFGWLGLAT